ncbi:MAG: glycosyltransferase [Saprospiraceae bacterium]
MIPGCDVVFFTLFRTDNPYSSISLSMAKELAKTQRVIYVNHPYTWRDIWAGIRAGDEALRRRLPDLLRGRVRYERLESIPQNFIAVQPPPTLPINWLPKGRIYQFFQRRNNAVVLRTIARALRDQKVQDYIFINCYDPFYAGVLPEKMGARLSIYHCIDDITQNAYTDKHGHDLENEAIRQADVTLVTSTNLQKLKVPFSDRVVTYFNAAEVAVFHKVWQEKYPHPVELTGRSGKVIGFVGNLDELRIDYPLLKRVAEAYPQHTLLLVGPVNSPELSQIGLDELPNVVLAGSRRLDELPPLMQYMDCVLIPFRCNTLTKSIYPLKINEYLAAGKAVVSTSFSDDIRGFADCIYLAEDAPTFISQIKTALEEDHQALVQQRIKVADTNTWTARIGQLWEIVEKFEPKE